jgi:hypothetical protein
LFPLDYAWLLVWCDPSERRSPGPNGHRNGAAVWHEDWRFVRPADAEMAWLAGKGWRVHLFQVDPRAGIIHRGEVRVNRDGHPRLVGGLSVLRAKRPLDDRRDPQ